MSAAADVTEARTDTIPPALASRNVLRWLTFFGPGAVIASLTIGAGELIFSSRAGSIFGYRLLWFFVLVLALKWVLAFATARHMVLTGAHPFQRWMELPGPRGWCPAVFLLLALVCFPIWVGFHAGTLGTLISWLAGTEENLRGGAYHVWGFLILIGVLMLVLAGGYSSLERIQLIIVALMLLAVVICLGLLRLDWLEFLKGLFVPAVPRYPEWIHAHAEVASRPVWVETITYVGVLGGSAYDYLAYVSYLRAKHWGRAGGRLAGAADVAAMARDSAHVTRKWVRAVWIDSVLSFLAVLLFAGVFVACGAIVLAPQHKIPGGANLLQLQAEFVSQLYPWLKPLYFVGAFLAIFGTLYGTIEVAPAILREITAAFRPGVAETHARRLRFWSILWVGGGGALVLIWSLLNHLGRGTGNPPGLIALLTPANLFTGVLGCGLVCGLSWWSDRRCLPSALWMPWPLRALNGAAALIFLALGIKAYWDHSGWMSYGILAGTLAAGWILVSIVKAAKG